MTTHDDHGNKGVEPAPEAELIRTARANSWPKLSQTDAAREIGISQTRWRDLERGWRWVRKGEAIANHAPADQVASAARLLRIPADAMRDAGRDDVADLLDRGRLPTAAPQPARPAGDRDLADMADDELFDEVGRLLDEVRRRMPGAGGGWQPRIVDGDMPRAARQVDDAESSVFYGDEDD